MNCVVLLGGEEGLKVYIVKENNQNARSHADPQAQRGLEYEIIDCVELARRWCLPESWVRGRVLQGVSDPIPHLRFGRYVRFRWGSPELNSWLERRTVAEDLSRKRRA
jgi:hypothetical protein